MSRCCRRIDERRLAVVVRGGADAETTAALAAQEEPLVEEDAVAIAHLVAGAAPAPDWSRRILDAHAEGFVAVGGSVETPDRSLRPVGAGRRPQPGVRASAAAPVAPRGPGAGRARGPARLRPATASRRSSTGGSDFDCHAVVDAAEDERPERERGNGGDDEVDHVADGRGHSPKKSGSRTASTGGVSGFPQWIRSTSRGWSCGARDVLERVEDRRQEEPGQQQGGDEVLDVAEDAFSDATASERPATKPTKQAASGIASHSVSRAAGM